MGLGPNLGARRASGGWVIENLSTADASGSLCQDTDTSTCPRTRESRQSPSPSRPICSTFAAQMKSFSEMPPIACVLYRTRHLL